jgi:CDP-6-deoxy-D-xylo-4-hexulose-3-dehydrase
VRIPLNVSTFDRAEISAACQVLESGQVTMGRLCAEFEAAFASYVGVKNAIFINSGSSANLVALFALANPELPQRDGRRRWHDRAEIIVPALTWSTTVWPIVQAGGIPVLVDCDPRTLQMDVDALEAAVSPDTVAVCPVHVLGNAVPMQQVHAFAACHGLWVIEDACEALGTRHADRFVGTTGDFGTYSFFFSHHITTIEGGMVVTGDDDLAELARCLRAHGWTRNLRRRKEIEARYPHLDPEYLFVNTGFNLRPTEVNAAFGLHQLRRLASFNVRRAEIASRWCEAFASLANAGKLSAMRATEGTTCTWFGFPVLCAAKEERRRLKEHLTQHEIETRPVVAGNLARHPAFRHIRHRIPRPLRGADEVMERGIYWGSHPMMRDEEIDYVAARVQEFFR